MTPVAVFSSFLLVLVTMNQVAASLRLPPDPRSQVEAWFYGICYSPYTAMGVCRTKAECEEDVGIIMKHSNRIRVYSTECPDVMHTLLQKASRGQLTLLLGVWIENSPRDQKEIKQLIEYLKIYPHASLDGIVVGNEVLFRRQAGPDYMGYLINDVKNKVRGLGFAVGSPSLQNVDVFSVEETPNAGVVGVSDAVGVNIHPFFDTTLKPPSDPQKFGQAAAARFKMKLNANRKKFPGKRIVVTETGWPTSSDLYSGDSNQASDLLQFHFVKEFMKVVHSDPVPYYFFEFKNADWKHGFGKSKLYSEYHFGIYYSNGDPKMVAG